MTRSFICSLLFLCMGTATGSMAAEVPTVLALGDSITAGGKSFVCYREVLVPALKEKGLAVTFVGPEVDATSAHAGYGGKNTRSLRKAAGKIYQKYPADIVLLHTGHNSFSKDKPVARIVGDTEAIMKNVWVINPKATVLLAQVIPAGKLPKYDYIPALNEELGRLAERLIAEKRPLVLVDHASGFDWKTDCVQDKVHPNASGAKKMADRWLAALLPVLDQ